MSSQNLRLGSEVVVISADYTDSTYKITGGERGFVTKTLDKCPSGLFIEVELNGRVTSHPFFPDQLRLA